MRGDVLTHASTESFVIEECSDCHVAFALSSSFNRERRESKTRFYCPNGHSLHYHGKTEAEKALEETERLRRNLESSRSQTAFWRTEQEREKRQHAATKGQLTKTKKRAAGGACPCCNRSFVDVARHMKSKHPDYAKET